MPEPRKPEGICHVHIVVGSEPVSSISQWSNELRIVYVTAKISTINGIVFRFFCTSGNANNKTFRSCIYCAPELSFLLALTASARSSSVATVDSQSIQASVMETPFFKPAGPSAGTFWLPSLMFDSIMAPMIEFSPTRSWSPMTFATPGWLR